MTKVLIAEDERPIARLLEMNLTRAGVRMHPGAPTA